LLSISPLHDQQSQPAVQIVEDVAHGGCPAFISNSGRPIPRLATMDVVSVMPRVPARHEFRIRSSQIQGVRPELEPGLPIRARSPSLRASIRKPSCLISCSHESPVGGCCAFVGRHGGTKPGRQVYSPAYRGTVRTVSKPLPLLQHIELEALRRLRERGRTFPGKWRAELARGCVPAAIGHTAAMSLYPNA
jgi:hypothetical protein